MRIRFLADTARLWLLGALLLPGAAADAPRAFERFVDDLPIPPRIRIPANGELTVTMRASLVKLHRDLPAQPAFTYEGVEPGPTIEAEAGVPARIRWRNELPAAHVLPAPAGGMGDGGPDVKAVVHLHGMATPQASIADRFHDNDGWPDLWLRKGEEQLAEYPNRQDARLLWYHDHAFGDTGRNVAAGLAGLYVIRDAFERSLGLPDGEFEVPLVFQAQGMNADGSRYYTPQVGLEFYGNAVAVNGKLFPRFAVQPRKYRFRMLNASNARSYALKLMSENGMDEGPPLHQIGSDGGFLADTVTLNDPADPDSPRLTLAPAERADVIIDFSAFAGKRLVLQNNSLDPGDGEMPMPQLMRFDVAAALAAPDVSRLPKHIRELPSADPSRATVTRRITYSRVKMANGMDMALLNGQMWRDPVTEKPRLGATEIWEIVNPLPDMHPFHVHLADFRVLDRRAFDVKRFQRDGTVAYTDAAEAADPNEQGWKDVVRTTAGTVTRILITFGPYPGHYVYHCHILEHEDMDMMRPFEVVP